MERPVHFGFLVGSLSALVLLGACHSWYLRSFRGPAHKGESNYFSTIARLQCSAGQRDARIAVVGSSLAGRLPGKLQGEADVMNLGVDGGTGGTSLRLLRSGAFRVPEWVAVEANLIRAGIDYPDPLRLEYRVHGWWFRAGAVIPELAAGARPSSLAYDALRRRGGHPGRRNPGHSNQPRAEVPKGTGVPSDLDPETRMRFERTVAAIRDARSAGHKIMLVWIPNGIGSKGLAPELVRYAESLAGACEVPFLDLRPLDEAGLILYTDAVHLSEESARLVLGCIRGEMSRIDEKVSGQSPRVEQ